MSERKRDRRDESGEDRRERSRSPQVRKQENIALDAKKRLRNVGIQIKLTPQKTPTKPKLTVAAAFNQDSDDEPEEIPAEARMRMRNIGRDTPTSSGPNSFGKTKQGFSDSKKVFEKNVTEEEDPTK